jgi:hypothetical protein
MAVQLEVRWAERSVLTLESPRVGSSDVPKVELTGGLKAAHSVWMMAVHWACWTAELTAQRKAVTKAERWDQH